MGGLNAIPVFGWFLSLFFAISMSIPFYFLWNSLGPVYFYWLPKVYHEIPFWHCVGLFILVPMVKFLVYPGMSSSSSSSVEKKN